MSVASSKNEKPEVQSKSTEKKEIGTDEKEKEQMNNVENIILDKELGIFQRTETSKLEPRPTDKKKQTDTNEEQNRIADEKDRPAYQNETSELEPKSELETQQSIETSSKKTFQPTDKNGRFSRNKWRTKCRWFWWKRQFIYPQQKEITSSDGTILMKKLESLKTLVDKAESKTSFQIVNKQKKSVTLYSSD